MGLFSSSKSTSVTNVTEVSQDNRVAIEGAPSGVFLSPASTLTQTFEGDVGLSGPQVSQILDGLTQQQDVQQERSADLSKTLASTFRGQTDKLVGIIEQLKTGGDSNLKFLPFAVLAFAAFVILRK